MARDEKQVQGQKVYFVLRLHVKSRNTFVGVWVDFLTATRLFKPP